eukprot:5520570-Prymnesium_polylepis.1
MVGLERSASDMLASPLCTHDLAPTEQPGANTVLESPRSTSPSPLRRARLSQKVWVATFHAGHQRERYCSMPPSPNHWRMRIEWKLAKGCMEEITDDPRFVAADLASKFEETGFEATINIPYWEEDTTVEIESSVALVSEEEPACFGMVDFFWQEPKHCIHDGEEKLTLSEAVEKQCLDHMGA